MAPAQAQALPTGQENTIVPEAVRDGIDLQINGEHYRHTGDPQMPLLWYLRDVLRLTGTKYGGEHGESGADLVLLDGKAVSAITQTMAKLAGKQVVTVEGLAANDGTLHPLQQAFIRNSRRRTGMRRTRSATAPSRGASRVSGRRNPARRQARSSK